MRYLLITLLLLGAAIGFGLLAKHDPGYVLINYSGWSLESSFSIFMLAALLTFSVFYLVLRLTFGTLHLPRRMTDWRQRHQTVHARELTHKGLIALAEGNWQEAEKKLSRAAGHSDTPLINYLGAARAAQKQGEEQRRDEYLSQAYQSMPDAELAVGLTQADLQLSQGQAEQALATLHYLHTIAPKHGYVLYLLKKIHERLQNWDELLDLLPSLKKQKVLDEEQCRELELSLHRMRLQRCASLERLEQLWQQVPRKLRHNPSLLYDYATLLQQLGDEVHAEAALREFLAKKWDLALIRLYGQLQGEDLKLQLTTAESWLSEHEHHPDLLLTLGRLTLKSQLWGMARSYLEASLGVEPRAETCCELGDLLQQLGETEQAGEYYKQGLELAIGNDCSHIVLAKQSAALQAKPEPHLEPAP